MTCGAERRRRARERAKRHQRSNDARKRATDAFMKAALDIGFDMDTAIQELIEQLIEVERIERGENGQG